MAPGPYEGVLVEYSPTHYNSPTPGPSHSTSYSPYTYPEPSPQFSGTPDSETIPSLPVILGDLILPPPAASVISSVGVATVVDACSTHSNMVGK